MCKRGTSLYDLITQDSKVQIDYECLTVSEIHNIISETPLTNENRQIAIKRYIELKTIDEIADEMHYDRRTVSDRLKLIYLDLQKVTIKLLGVEYTKNGDKSV